MARSTKRDCGRVAQQFANSCKSKHASADVGAPAVAPAGGAIARGPEDSALPAANAGHQMDIDTLDSDPGSVSSDYHSSDDRKFSGTDEDATLSDVGSYR